MGGSFYGGDAGVRMAISRGSAIVFFTFYSLHVEIFGSIY